MRLFIQLSTFSNYHYFGVSILIYVYMGKICIIYVCVFSLQLLTDLNYGVAMDEVLKLNAREQPTYMYQFNYKSWTDWRPKWMGETAVLSIVPVDIWR